MIENTGYDEKDLPNPVIRLGLACNEKCIFCNVPPESREISGEEYARRQIISAHPGSCVSFSGGEPTLYSFLPRLIEFAVERGIVPELQTNAVLLSDSEYVRKLADAGLKMAFVSLHSHIAGIHDFLTGVKGSWEKGICGIHNLLESGIHVSINAVISSVNYAHISDFVLFLSRRLGVRQLSLSVVQPRGRAWSNKAIVPDYSLLDKPVRNALKTADNEHLMIINPICGLPMCIGGWNEYRKLCTEYVQYCAGKKFCAGKIHAPKCKDCMAGKYCAGVWQEYYDLKGDSALKPFNETPG